MNAALVHRLLIIDDDAAYQRLVTAALRNSNVEILSVLHPEHAIETASKFLPDLILLDYEMPTVNGLEVLRQLQADTQLASIPVIFVTGNDNQQILLACFQAGAIDYIRKPFCIPELRARVNSVLDRSRMVRQLQQLAHFDSLTGLANRASMHKYIQRAIDHKGLKKSALLFLDLDRFKWVNDSLGHDIGDELLRETANRLRSSIRCSDHIAHLSSPHEAARLGGDEFVILLNDLTHPEDAVPVAERILTLLAAPYCVSGHTVYTTASIGVVSGFQHYHRPGDILRDADIAMYEAKSTGKGRYSLFTPAMHARAQQRLEMERGLRVALANQELFLMYQPIVSLESKRVEGFEALVRWQHPTLGLVAPNDFVPVAEETGLIIDIGTWALDEACREFSRWQKAYGDAAPKHIHVNLSRQQLDRELVPTVCATLDRHSLSPANLHLEVTEDEIMQNPDLARAVLEDLRRIRVSIDMDDFGTGYSSLACLQTLPIDVLKIDRSFISNLEHSTSLAALVQAVTLLSQNLGLTTVAEGIESVAQLTMLQAIGCEFGQGYYFARPLLPSRVGAYLGHSEDRRAGALMLLPDVSGSLSPSTVATA